MPEKMADKPRQPVVPTSAESVPDAAVARPVEPASVAPASAPEPAPTSEPAPAPADAPRQFIRPKVDIEALRRSINESLKKQAENNTPPSDPPKQ